MPTSPDREGYLPPEAEVKIEQADAPRQTALFRLADYKPLAAALQSHYQDKYTYVRDYRAEQFFKEHKENLITGISKLLVDYEKARNKQASEQVQAVAHEFANVIDGWLERVGIHDAHDLPRGYAYKPEEVYNYSTHHYEPKPHSYGQNLFLIGKTNERETWPGKREDDMQLSGSVRRLEGESWGESADGMRGAGSSTWYVYTPDTYESLQLLKDIRDGLLDDLTKYVEERQTAEIEKLLPRLRQQWDKTPGEGNPVGHKTLGEFPNSGKAWHYMKDSLRPLYGLLLDPEQAQLFEKGKDYTQAIEQEALLLLTGDWQTWKHRAGHLTSEALQNLKAQCGYKNEEGQSSVGSYLSSASGVGGRPGSKNTSELYQAFRAEPDIAAALKGNVPEKQLRQFTELEKQEFSKRRAKDFWAFMEHGSPQSVPPDGSPILQLKQEVEVLVAEKLTQESYLNTGLSPGEFEKWGFEWLKAKDMLEGKGGYNMPNQPADFSEAQKILEQLKTLLGSRQEKVDAGLQQTIEHMRRGKYGYRDSLEITTQGGKIIEVKTFTDNPAEIKNVSLGQGWGKLSLGQARNKINTTHGGKYVYILPDNGTVLMDGKGMCAIVVNKDGDSYIAQESLTTYRQGEEPNIYSSEADFQTAGNYTNQQSDTGRGGASLADAFKKAEVQSQVPAQEASGQPKKEPKPQKEKPIKTTHPAEGQQHMTPDAHQALFEDFAFIATLLADMKQLGLKLPDAQQEKVRELKTELAKAPDESKANPVSLLGTIRAIRASIESQYKSQSSKITNKEWAKTYEDLWRQTQQAVRENSDAQEFINAGIATEEEVLKKVRAKLTANLVELQRGGLVNVNALLTATLGEF